MPELIRWSSEVMVPDKPMPGLGSWRLKSSSGVGVNRILSMLLLLIIGAAVFFFITWFGRYQNPSRKGKTDAKLTKTYEIQVTADKVARPNQGSSQPSMTTGAGLLYLISNKELHSLKIGISKTNSETDRIQNHQEYGWQLEKCWNFDDHINAQQVEGATIAWWRNHLKVEPSVAKHEMPQGGYTETASLNSVSLGQVYEYVHDLCLKANGKEAISVPISGLIVGAVMQTNGTLEYAASKTRTAKFEGDYRWHQRTHYWQQWVISENGKTLTIELNQNNSTPIKQLKIGGRVDVVGRVELVNGELRMTNPDYNYTKKKLLSSKHVQHTNKSKKSRASLFSSSKPKISAKIEQAKKAKPAVRSKPSKPKTEFEKKMNVSLGDSKNVTHSQLAERCSSCGALVANGAAHDCR